MLLLVDLRAAFMAANDDLIGSGLPPARVLGGRKKVREKKNPSLLQSSRSWVARSFFFARLSKKVGTKTKARA